MTRALLAAAALLAAVPACAEDMDRRPVRMISVTGEGTVAAVPDIAVLRFSVETRADVAGAAFSESSRLMNAVLAALEAQGIEPRDRQTGQIRLNPIYARDRDNGYQDRSRIVAYEALTTLTVRLRNIEAAGSVIDAAVKAGANGLDSFSLAFDDPQALEAEARVAAVRDAVAKAEAMAEAAGARLGEVLTLSAGGGGGMPRPEPMMRSMVMAEAADVPVIEAGEERLRVTVSATFALE